LAASIAINKSLEHMNFIDLKNINNIKNINSAIEALEKHDLSYNINFKIRKEEIEKTEEIVKEMEYKEKGEIGEKEKGGEGKEKEKLEEKIEEMKIKGRDYEVLIKADMIKEEKPEELKIDINRDLENILITILNTGFIEASFSGDGLYIVIKKKKETLLKAIGNEWEIKMDEGLYNLKGPFNIFVITRYIDLLYKVKEPVNARIKVELIKGA